jgi:hypothetical protein
MAQGEAYERGLQVTAVHTSFGRQRGERCASTRRGVGREEAEVCGRSEGPFVDRRIGAGPDAAQLAQEDPHRRRSPTRQRIKGGFEQPRIADFGEGGDSTPMVFFQSSREVMEACRGTEVVARVSACVEQPDEFVPRPVTRVGDRLDTGIGEHAVRALGNSCRDARTEESRGEEPPFHLGWAAVEVDAEFCREPPAESLHDASCEPRAARGHSRGARPPLTVTEFHISTPSRFAERASTLPGRSRDSVPFLPALAAKTDEAFTLLTRRSFPSLRQVRATAERAGLKDDEGRHFSPVMTTSPPSAVGPGVMGPRLGQSLAAVGCTIFTVLSYGLARWDLRLCCSAAPGCTLATGRARGELGGSKMMKMCRRCHEEKAVKRGLCARCWKEDVLADHPPMAPSIEPLHDRPWVARSAFTGRKRRSPRT